jgi:hypothetical protein
MSPGYRALLDSIRWDELKPAYGGGAEIRSLLEEVFSHDATAAESALDEAYERLCHQETIGAGTAAVLPALFALLDEPEVRIKPAVLSVLGTIWELCAERTSLPGLFPAAVPFVPEEARDAQWAASEREYAGLLQDLYGAFEQWTHALSALLEAPDPDVRGRSARISAFSLLHAGEISGRIRLAYAVEQSREVKAVQLLSLGVLCSTRFQQENAALISRAGGNEDELVRQCAAIAGAWAEPAQVTDERITELGRIAELPRLELKYFHWLRGAIAGLAGDALSRLWSSGRAGAEWALFAALRFQATEGSEADGAEPGEDWPLPSLLAEYAEFAVLKEFDGRGDEVLARELSAAQKEALAVAGAELGLYTWAQQRCGVPLRTSDLDRYLGLVPPGPLDRQLQLSLRTKTADWPLWKWIRFAQRNGLEETLIDALTRRLSLSEIVDLYKDVASGAYDPTNLGPSKPVPLAERLAERPALADAAVFEQYANELLLGTPSVSQAAAAVIPLLRREPGRASLVAPLIEILVKNGGNLRKRVLVLLRPEDRARFERIPATPHPIPEGMRKLLSARKTR